MHAKYLGEQALLKQKTESAFASEASIVDGDKKTAKLDSLFDSLYDQNGQTKTANLNQKAVINGPVLEILESQGNSLSFQGVDAKTAEQYYDTMKWNKSLKIVQPLPQF